MEVGKRTIPGTIDFLSIHDPEKLWALVPKDAEAFSEGAFERITFARLANAIDSLAWFLDSRFPGRLESDGLTVCYIGPVDIRYLLLACAACKCGIKVLFSSPRNTLEAHLSLIGGTGCKFLLGPLSRTNVEILEALKLPNFDIPSLESLLSSTTTERFPWNCFWEEVAGKTFAIFHTSGTTHLPKPVEVYHGTLSTVDTQKQLAAIDGRTTLHTMWLGLQVYVALPPFHGAATNFFAFSVFQDTTTVFGPPDVLPSLDVVEHMLDLGVAKGAFLAPSILTEIAQDPRVLEKLSQWSFVAYGGGPLSKGPGNAIWQRGTKVLSMLGATETFNLPELIPQHIDEWEYHAFHPASNIHFKNHTDTFFELVLRRENSLLQHQGIFWTFPDIEDYPMKDLYEPHPTKPDLWKYVGRVDDITVLENGEKFNPKPSESCIASHAQVKTALIVGTGRVQPVLLIEPQAGSELAAGCDTSRVLSLLKTVVVEANALLPGHAQIHFSHIRVVQDAQLFPRSGKGELQRVRALKALQYETDQAYIDAEAQGHGSSFELDYSSVDAFSDTLLRYVREQNGRLRLVTVRDNLFACGFDSLHALQLTRAIKSSLGSEHQQTADQITLRLIYQKPTIEALACSLVRSIQDGASVKEPQVCDTTAGMQQLLDIYLQEVEGLKPANMQAFNRGEVLNSKQVVLLTGSTGSLGSYLLDALLSDATVEKVVCVNRRGGNKFKQGGINAGRGLSTDFRRVNFMETDLAAENLDLDDDSFRELADEITCIVHNAWPVNFNLDISSFKPQLEGCIQLLKLASLSKRHPKIVFASSIGAANGWLSSGHSGFIPELPLLDFNIAEPMGYAQSKLLAEQILARGCQRFQLPLEVCRIGQIAGPVMSSKGEWNRNEWFPAMILACRVIRKVPNSLGAMEDVNWIPVDQLAKVLCDVIEMPAQASGGISHPGVASTFKRVLDLIGQASTFLREVLCLGTTTKNRPTKCLRQLDDAENKIIEDSASSKYDSESGEDSASNIASVQSQVRYVHLVNPQVSKWRDLAPAMKSQIGQDDSSGQPVELVSMNDWIATLKQASRVSQGPATVEPQVDNAVKLLDFYEHICDPQASQPKFNTSVARQLSPHLSGLPAVSVEWLRKWFAQWESASA
ncbi:acetyl-CoA synthetase-like protein [Polychaeton citri CBS 116435]|uniref:Acetyl-CoA synthetase-like protein n=1 Tax=Polychaeton citri CBS 116435 TaxID=1314669 RepID=A0A9P4Q659_9PEZI|nr:acetyl-CoA synthetase-like protein [Polychaeton citri CBS 116435]